VTEAEAFEIAQIASANALTAFTVYITFAFGYLAAAYFVGKQLSRTQAIILSLLYALSATSCALAHLGYLEAQGAASAQAPTYYPSSILNNTDFWRLYMGPLEGLGIFASLYFMWSTRRSED